MRQLLSFLGAGGQAEVHEERFAPVIEHEVGRFEIAVHDALAMGIGQSLGKLANDLDGLCQGHRGFAFGLTLEAIGQRLAANEGIGDVEVLALLTIFIDGHDVGMAQAGGGLGFAEEALDALLGIAAAELGDLEGHGPIQEGIVRQIDLAEGAFAQEFLEHETANGGHFQRGSGRCRFMEGFGGQRRRSVAEG